MKLLLLLLLPLRFHLSRIVSEISRPRAQTLHLITAAVACQVHYFQAQPAIMIGKAIRHQERDTTCDISVC